MACVTTPFRLSAASGIVFAICSSLVGCAADHDPQHPYDDGWRLARISRIGDELPSPGTRPHDCRLASTPSGDRPARYAEVWFVEIRRVRYLTVRLPDAGLFRDGEYLHINLRDCSLAADVAR
jgi:hypothetical protein